MLDQSGFDHQLTHNNTPPETVINDVRIRLQEAETQLDDIDAQIQALQKRAEILGSTSIQYKSILSPFRLVPDDILREIFCRTLELYADETTSFQIVDRQRDWLPLLFTQICHRWREVAHTTPRLWAEIMIQLPPIIDTRNGRPRDAKLVDVNSLSVQCTFLAREADRIRQWLGRSGALPLSLKIFQRHLSWYLPRSNLSEPYIEDSDLNPQFSSQLSMVFELVSSYLPRCESLTFRLPRGHSYQLFSAHITPTKIQNIKCFRPSFQSSRAGSLVEVLETPLFTALPALRMLRVSPEISFLLQEPGSWPFSPNTWRDLTSLDVEGSLSNKQAAVFFTNCPGLIQFTLHITDDVYYTQSQSPITKLPMHNLEHLTIHFRRRYRQPVLVLPTGWTLEKYGVFAPALRRLEYTIFARPSVNDDIPPLDSAAGFPLSFMLQSAECLTSLTINPQKAKERGFRPALQVAGIHLTRLILKATRVRAAPRVLLQQPGNENHNMVSEVDSVFLDLFPLPEWCKLPSFAAPFPLVEVDGVNTDEFDKHLEDQLCPRLEHLQVSNLCSIREEAILSFIVYRLRLYEYALCKWGHDAGKPFGPLTGLTATIVGKTSCDPKVDIKDSVEKLAAVIGVQFTLKVDYVYTDDCASNANTISDSQLPYSMLDDFM